MEVELTHRAARDLDVIKRRHPKLLTRLLDKLETLGEDPLAGKPLTGPLKGLRSLRVGDWRVIYVVGRETVTVLTVNDRKEVHR
jgi:addiction module RelE/StbE family toxin